VIERSRNMNKYSFLDELIIVEGIVSDLNSALSSTNMNKVEDACRQLKNASNRILRKLQKYDDFYEHAEIVSFGVRRQTFIDFDKSDSQTGKEHRA
jgi:hypothetical protein